MPSYNTERFVGEAIASVLDQSLDDLELIVVDDGSSDRSREIVQEIANRDRRVRPLRNTRAKGVSGARNTALQVASATWIAFLDSDDVMLPESLEVRLRAAAANPQFRFISGDFAKLAESGEVLVDGFFTSKPAILDALQRQEHRDGCYLIADPVGFFLTNFELAIPATVLVHSSLIDEVGLFDETMTHGEDVDYWFRLGLPGNLLFLPRTVAGYRVRAGSARTDRARVIAGDLKLHKKIIDNPDFDSYGEKRIDRYLRDLDSAVEYCRTAGAFRDGFTYAFDAAKLRPFRLATWKYMAACTMRRA